MAEAELEKRPSEIIPQVSTAPAEPDPKRAKIEILINEIDDKLVSINFNRELHKLEKSISSLRQRLDNYECTFKKIPHRNSIKTLIMTMAQDGNNEFEAFYALKMLISDSSHKFIQFCTLGNVKNSLYSSMEGIMMTYLSLISRAYGPDRCASEYQSFNLMSPNLECPTCPHIHQRIQQEQQKFNTMLSAAAIKSFILPTAEDELAVRKELVRQKEQEDNNDFSEVSDFSELDYLSDDEAFLSEKSEYKLPKYAREQAEKLAQIAAKGKNSQVGASGPFITTSLDYSSKRADIPVPTWSIVDENLFIESSSKNVIHQSQTLNEQLSDGVFVNRHLEPEVEERTIPPAITKKSKRNSLSQPSSISNSKKSASVVSSTNHK